MLWPEESPRSITLLVLKMIDLRVLWPEESPRSITLLSPQPARLARVVALLDSEKHELNWCGLGSNARISCEHGHLAKLAIGHGEQPYLPFRR